MLQWFRGGSVRPEYSHCAQCFLGISSGLKMDRHEATENSPLLGQLDSAPNAAGEGRNGAIANDGGVNGVQNGFGKPAEDEESQRDGGEEATQYQGMPEVKAKLAYIVPAISIGVCRTRIWSSPCSNAPDLSCSSGSDHNRIMLWHYR